MSRLHKLHLAAQLLVGTAIVCAPSAFAADCGTNDFVIDGTDPAACTTNGDITVSGKDAVKVTNNGATFNITVRQGDKITSENGSAFTSTGTSSILNNGTISAKNSSLSSSSAAIGVYSGTTTIENRGTISSSASAGYASTFDVRAEGTAKLTNHGDIVGTISIANTKETANVISNYGSLRSDASAISLSGNSTVTINQLGQISASDPARAAITTWSSQSKITLNIYPGSEFKAQTALALSSKTDTGSTINFYTSNYSLAVQNFLYGPNKNTVTVPNGALLAFTGADTVNGNGTLVVSTPAPAPGANTPSVAQASATAVQSALQMTTPRNYVPPLQNTVPDVGQSASGAGSSASAPAAGFSGQSNLGMSNLDQSNLGMSDVRMNLRGTQTDDIPSGNGQRIDRHGNLVWARAFGAARFQPANDGIAGSINRTTGVLFGYDRQFTTWRLGAYGGYGLNNSILTNNSAKLQTQLYLAGLYGQTRLAATTFTFNLAGGLLGNTSTRYINNAAEVAAGDFRGSFLAPDAAIAYDMRLGGGFTLTPALRARYIATFTDNYAETGSTQNIVYRSAFTSSVEERAELRLSHKQAMANGGSFGSYVQAAAIATQRIGSGAVSASILGTEVSVQSATAGTVTGLSIGGGLDVELSKDLVTYAGIDATEYSDAAKALTGRIGFRLAF